MGIFERFLSVWRLEMKFTTLFRQFLMHFSFPNALKRDLKF